MVAGVPVAVAGDQHSRLQLVGQSDRPDPEHYEYTFVNLANTIDEFTERIGLTKYFAYMFDFGAPIALLLGSRHPERILGKTRRQGLERCVLTLSRSIV